jgi:hypothetical protein
MSGLVQPYSRDAVARLPDDQPEERESLEPPSDGGGVPFNPRSTVRPSQGAAISPSPSPEPSSHPNRRIPSRGPTVLQSPSPSPEPSSRLTARRSSRRLSAEDKAEKILGDEEESEVVVSQSPEPPRPGGSEAQEAKGDDRDRRASPPPPKRSRAEANSRRDREDRASPLPSRRSTAKAETNRRGSRASPPPPEHTVAKPETNGRDDPPREMTPEDNSEDSGTESEEPRAGLAESSDSGPMKDITSLRNNAEGLHGSTARRKVRTVDELAVVSEEGGSSSKL